MLYTVGHTKNYRKAIAEHGTITKLPGGIAFETVDEAREWVRDKGREHIWSVWKLDGCWERDTEPSDKWGHVITVELDIMEEISGVCDE